MPSNLELWISALGKLDHSLLEAPITKRHLSELNTSTNSWIFYLQHHAWVPEPLALMQPNGRRAYHGHPT